MLKTIKSQFISVTVIVSLVLLFFLIGFFKDSIEKKRTVNIDFARIGISRRINELVKWQAYERELGSVILGTRNMKGPGLSEEFFEINKKVDKLVRELENNFQESSTLVETESVHEALRKWRETLKTFNRDIRSSVFKNEITPDYWFQMSTVMINTGKNLQSVILVSLKSNEKMFYINAVLLPNISRLAEQVGRLRAYVAYVISKGESIFDGTVNPFEQYNSVILENMDQILILKDKPNISPSIKEAIERLENEYLNNFDYYLDNVRNISYDHAKIIGVNMENILEMKKIFEGHLFNDVEDLTSLSLHESVLNFAEALDQDDKINLEQYRKNVEQVFFSFSQITKTFFKVRFIDQKGMEQVRVDYDNDRPEILPVSKLQNKRNKEYFKGSIDLKPGEIYCSRLNLNMEYGKIDTPFKPVLRYAAPVYNNGKSLGVLVFSLLADEKRLLNFGKEENDLSKTFLLDENGYYIYHPDQKKRWGMMPQLKRTERNFKNDFPTVSEEVFSKEEGSVVLESGRHLLYKSIFSPKEVSIKRRWILVKEMEAVVYPFSEKEWLEIATQFIGSAFEISNAVDQENRAIMVKVAAKTRTSFMIGILFLFLGGIGTFYYVRWIRRRILFPVFDLQKEIKNVCSGDLTRRVKIKYDDELGALGKSFNEMTEELEKHTRDLTNLKFSLDQHSIVGITDQKGIILYVNDKFSEISKYSNKELIGQDHRILNSGYHSKDFMRDMWRAISSGKVWHDEIKNKAKDGTYYWVDTSIIPFLNEEGKPFQYIAIRTDITEVKNMAADLILKKTLAEEMSIKAQDAVKAKSEFLANMSHEIRTPMNAVLGFSDLLAKTEINDKQKDYLDTVRSSGKLLCGIIDDILDLSKLESGKIVLESIDFDLYILISDVFKMIVARMRDRPFDTYIDIDKKISRFYRGDPTRLKQVLVNLLGNAVKFTEKGQIGVIVEGVDQNEKEGVTLRFIVRDSGIGIPKDKLESIFQPFTQEDETTTRRFGGTGLGLTIVRNIVEAMYGSIWIESEVGKGSDFIFEIKLKEGSFEGASEDLVIDKGLMCKKVFIVDDNTISCRIINKCCNFVGLEVLSVADSGHTALRRLDKLALEGKIPDVILCDIMMEGMDGYELVDKIRANDQFKNTKFLAITADLKLGEKNVEGKVCFDRVLNKPVVVEVLIDAVTELLLGKKLERISSAQENDKNNDGLRDVKILVVEDSLPNQNLMAAYMKEIGCEAEYANNGQESIEKLLENKYDLCFMDMQMPVLGGVEATVMIRKSISKNMTIIALTANVLEEDKKKALDAGMNDFLTKPISLETLKKMISKYT